MDANSTSSIAAQWPILLGAALIGLGFVLALAALGGRLLAERRARRAELLAAVYATLADHARDGFLIVDAAGDGVLMSDLAREWLGLPAAARDLDGLAPGPDDQGLDTDSHRLLLRALRDIAGDHRDLSITLMTAAGRRLAARLATIRQGGRATIVAWLEDQSPAMAGAERQSRELATLRRDRDQLQMLAAAAPLPVALWSNDLKLAYVNPAYVAAVEGESAQQVLAQNAELAPPVHGKSLRDHARAAQESGKPQQHIARVVVAGRRRVLSLNHIPAADGAVTLYAFDVTDAEESRAELARFSNAQAETLNTLSTPVAIFGAEKQLIYYNSTFASLARLGPEYLASRPHHGELLERMRAARRLPEQANFSAWKKAVLDQYTELLAPAEEMWHLADDTAWRVVTQPHPLGGLLVLFEDVTDKLALERNYNTLIEVQRTTLNNLHEAVAVFGGTGHLRLTNAGFAKMWRFEEAELDAAPHISEIVERWAPLLNQVEDGETLEQTVRTATVARQSATGRIGLADGRVIDYSAVPLPDGAALMSFNDITDSFRIETALRDRNEALETADRLKSEFVANMSYELRTPLTSIIGFSEMLANEYFGPLNDKQQGYVGNILTASERLQLLINDVLDLAVTEAGAIALDVSTLVVADLVESTVALATEQARAKKHRLEAKVTKTCGTIEGDERRLKQVLYNLITNAVQFTPEGGEIKVEARRRGDMIELSVADTGVGVAQAERDKVFDRFHRGAHSSQNSGANGGVGLGLSLVRRFVELHGGKVTLNSDVGKGTVVTCRLPARQQP